MAWQKNIRRGVCPAGRDCTFGGNPLAGRADDTTKIPHTQIYAGFFI